MIDIHTHILPDFDDGSSSEEMSFCMLKEEIEQGVREVILTPHSFSRDCKCIDKHQILSRFETFKRRASALPVKLSIGEEIFFSEPGFLQYVREDRFLKLGESRYYLVEFNMEEDDCDIENAVYDLISSGYPVILAHPERYRYMSIGLMDRLKAVGCRFQLNASSLLGGNGRRIKKLSKAMVRSGYCDFIGSDCHNLASRKPNLKEGRDYLKRTFKVDCDNENLYHSSNF